MVSAVASLLVALGFACEADRVIMGVCIAAAVETFIAALKLQRRLS